MASGHPCGDGDGDPLRLPGSLNSGFKVVLRGKREALLVLLKSLELAGLLPRTSSKQCVNQLGWPAKMESETLGPQLRWVLHMVKGVLFSCPYDQLAPVITANVISHFRLPGWSSLLFESLRV